jgi:hypothetical protein
MQLTKKQIYIIVGVVVLIIALIIIRAKVKQSKANKEPETIDTEATDVTPNDTFPLKKGKRGKRVEQLQTWLVQKYGAKFPQYGVDGIWGNETEEAVNKHLKRDNVSQEYWNKMEGVTNIVTNNFK